MSDDTESPGDQKQGTVDGYLLLGEEHVILVRPWTHGEQSAYTILKIFAQTSGYEDLEELSGCGELFPELSSETIAELLDNGKLIKLDSPVPVPAPKPHRTNKELARKRPRT